MILYLRSLHDDFVIVRHHPKRERKLPAEAHALLLRQVLEDLGPRDGLVHVLLDLLAVRLRVLRNLVADGPLEVVQLPDRRRAQG